MHDSKVRSRLKAQLTKWVHVSRAAPERISGIFGSGSNEFHRPNRRKTLLGESIAGMQNLFLFIGNVSAHLVALMSGLVAFGIAIFENIKNHRISARAFWIIGGFFLLVACDLAWQDEHRNAQAVIAEKAAEVGAKNSCLQDARVVDAYRRGLEDANLKERQTIDRQQSAVNSCVVSLGKLNPKVNKKFTVLPFFVGSRTGAAVLGAQKQNVFEIVILTNHRAEPSGNLKCDVAFSPMGSARFFQSASSVMRVNVPPERISESEYHVQVNELGAFWTDDNPIHFEALSASTNLGHCLFTPIR